MWTGCVCLTLFNAKRLAASASTPENPVRATTPHTKVEARITLHYYTVQVTKEATINFKMFLLSTAIARLHSVEAISYIRRLVCVASRPINRTLSSDEYPPGHQRQAAEAATIPLSHHASIIFPLSPQYNVDKKKYVNAVMQCNELSTKTTPHKLRKRNAFDVQS